MKVLDSPYFTISHSGNEYRPENVLPLRPGQHIARATVTEYQEFLLPILKVENTELVFAAPWIHILLLYRITDKDKISLSPSDSP